VRWRGLFSFSSVSCPMSDHRAPSQLLRMAEEFFVTSRVMSPTNQSIVLFYDRYIINLFISPNSQSEQNQNYAAYFML